MPASILTELIIKPFFEVVVYGSLYLTGLIIIPIFTFGKFTVEQLAAPRHRKARPRNDQSPVLTPGVVSADAAAFFGMLFWLAVIIVGFLLWQGMSPN